MRFCKRTAMFLLTISLPLTIAAAEEPKEDTQPVEVEVGMPSVLRDRVLPGSLLKARPIDFKSTIVLRVKESYPHGTDFRYDLEFYGLEPGDYDLRDFLKREDGTSLDGVPSIPVRIVSVLAPGQVEPNPLLAKDVGGMGGYTVFLIVAGVVWVLGLFGILFYGKNRRRESTEDLFRPKTLAERLRPLVELAMDGKLSKPRQAELELALVAYWRKRLDLEERTQAEVLAELRTHREAGPLLTALEDWLHRPKPRDGVDLEVLLQPYRNLPDQDEAARDLRALETVGTTVGTGSPNGGR